jgi:4-alpha-glucanotransferase
MKLAPDKKRAGILVPSFALRTESDLGVGDTEGVRQMIDWCHAHNLSVLQLLPINETSDDNSPYNAISSMAIEPSTIAVSPQHIPDLAAETFERIATPDLLASLRRGPVQYRKVKDLKWNLLGEAFKVFCRDHLGKKTARFAAFQEFLEKHCDWVSDYALFRVLMQENDNLCTWDRWPQEHRRPKHAWTWLFALSADRREEVTNRLLFFMYVQWIAYDQWTGLKGYGGAKNVFLMGDIPIGVSRYSADVWANPTIFDLEWSGGAPPETFFKVDEFVRKWGQNWGVPMYRWDILKQRNYDWWRTRVDNIQDVFHLFRIDHVLGFFRMYAFPWKPEENATFTPLNEDQARERTGGRLPGFQPYPDDSPEHCAINQQQGEQLLSMVREAAGETTVVAEDLGIVPDYVEPTLQKLGMPGFKIPHFLRDPHTNRFRDPKQYPLISLATLGTHDHQPLAAYWSELWRRVDAGDPHHADDGQRWESSQARFELSEFMRVAGLGDEPAPRELTPRVHEACLRMILSSNSWLAIFMITDVFAQASRFNVPGAHADSNWTARMEQTVAQLREDPTIAGKARMLAKAVRDTNRAP